MCYGYFVSMFRPFWNTNRKLEFRELREDQIRLEILSAIPEWEKQLQAQGEERRGLRGCDGSPTRGGQGEEEV